MGKDSAVRFQRPEAIENPLTKLVNSGAKRLIQQAEETEPAQCPSAGMIRIMRR